MSDAEHGGAVIAPIDPAAIVPPYEQLRTQVARRAASGDLAPGTRLPTVRALATELGVAPGTVARAYRELETDGVVVTRGRHGTFLSSTPAAAGHEAHAAATSYVGSVRALGLGREDAHRLLDEVWTAPS